MTFLDQRPAALERGGRTRSLLAPVVVAAMTAVSVVFVAFVDPHQPGHYPLCPLKALTGLDCPGCGSLRAVHDLAHGDVVGALDHNLLLVVAVPFLLWRWGRWARWSARAAETQRSFLVRPVWLWALVAAVAAFTVARNLGVPFLGSGVG